MRLPSQVRSEVLSISSSTILAMIAVGLASVLLLIPSAAGAPPAWSPSNDPPSWSNGVVLCNFQSFLPAVVVSSPQLPDSGMASSVGILSEVSPTGRSVAVADLGGYNWTSVNISNEDQFAVSYSGTLPVGTPYGFGPVVGVVSVELSYVLPAYRGSLGGNVSAVALQIQISNWPWQHPSDSLTLTLPVAPAFPQREHLVTMAPTSYTIGSVSNQSGHALEYLALDTSAEATSSQGSVSAIGISPQISLLPSSASIALAFGTGAGAFQSVNYTAHIGVILPSSIAGIPLYEFVLVGALAGIIALIVGLSGRRLRRGPSDLIYVNEEP